jgi:hypothetical protein
LKRSNLHRPDQPVSVGFEAGDVVVTLANGEIVRNPLYWHPWLASAAPEQRLNVEYDALSVFWPDLDEGLDIEGMRRGIPSEPSMRATQTIQRIEREITAREWELILALRGEAGEINARMVELLRRISEVLERQSAQD